ncbi:hypothetical protein [Blastococcus capsensis]|uniref:hypothetical protein n=1 Tax=Blastococcus capsensis TaxID=1564163 RepID=UPI00253FC415|nr:hypothetical protein [Blastococcus capsensis]MDK3258962.1 hypothetical protein [Blastococcus capsensis]
MLFFVCAILLCAAVGMTWYGPAKEKPRVQVLLANGSLQCGEVVSLDTGRLTLKTAEGRMTLDLTQAAGLSAVDSCRPARQ